MMTVAATLKQQHRHVLDDVTAACEAVLWGEPAPSLLPTLDALTKSSVLPRSSIIGVNAY